MPETLSLSAAFLIGLLGSTHCVGMCGGIMGALAYAVPPEKRTAGRLLPLLLSYNCGRLISYTLAGALIGAGSWYLASIIPTLGLVLRLLAGLMLIAMGLYLANWWPVLRHLERAGSHVWRLIQPAVASFMPVSSLWRALAVGTLWGWIPCGLVYSTLAWAATAPDWQQSARIMLFFGLGTLPAVLATGIFLEGFKKLLQRRLVRQGAALLIIGFGLWTLPLHGLLSDGHHAHAPAASGQMPHAGGHEQPQQHGSDMMEHDNHHHPVD